MMKGLGAMIRPASLPQGAALVGFGAYGARHAIVPGAWWQLGLTTLASAAVSSSSMLLNDLVDYRLGVDTALSQPDRPLVRGDVQPQQVQDALQLVHIFQLFALCCLQTLPARLILLVAMLVTTFYTLHLKPVLVVKNVACALVVAAAPAFGAVAVSGQLRTALRPAMLVFCVITHREILMDIEDREGDAAAGLRTLATVFGARGAVAMAAAPLAAAASLTPAKTALLVQAGVSFLSLALAVQTAPLALALALLA